MAIPDYADMSQYIADIDSAYTPADRINQRANSKLPAPDQIAKLIRAQGVWAACARWGHLYTSSMLVKLANGLVQPGGYAAGWERRRASAAAKAA